jgi:hypothetical protein
MTLAACNLHGLCEVLSARLRQRRCRTATVDRYDGREEQVIRRLFQALTRGECSAWLLALLVTLGTLSTERRLADT